jgi:DNA polymerase III subunit delta'
MSFRADQAFELLRESLQNGRLAHAYLITGEPGSGKRRLALDLVNLISGRRSPGFEEARGEFIQVVQPESKSRRIRVDAMREVERRLNLAAPRDNTKIAVVLDAERLMPEAANASLKTLEEPPPQSLIILVTAFPGQLLDTTRSRCLHVPLFRSGQRSLDETEIRLVEAMRTHCGSGTGPGAAPGGSLAAAWSLLQAFQDLLKEMKEAIEQEHAAAMKEEVAVYRQRTEGDWLKQREEYFKGLTEAFYLEKRDALLQVLVAWHGDALRALEGGGAASLPGYERETARFGERWGVRELLRRIDALEELRDNLQTNVSEGLALEAGMLAVFGD